MASRCRSIEDRTSRSLTRTGAATASSTSTTGAASGIQRVSRGRGRGGDRHRARTRARERSFTTCPSSSRAASGPLQGEPRQLRRVTSRPFSSPPESARSWGSATTRAPLYASPTHLVYSLGREVFAAPFDAQSARLTGRGIPVLTDVETDSRAGTPSWRCRSRALSPTCPDRGSTKPRLAWKDRSGVSRGRSTCRLRSTGAFISRPTGGASPSRGSGSPGGRSSPSISGEESSTPSWRTPSTTLTPLFSPSGREIAYASGRDGPLGPLRDRSRCGRRSRGGSVRQPGHRLPKSWSPDGRFLAYRQRKPDEDFDLWALPVNDPEPSSLPDRESPCRWRTGAEFSRDGKWIAYESAMSGRHEIYVARFDPGNRTFGRPEPVSTRWRLAAGLVPRRSRALLPQRHASAIMKVDVLRTEPELELGTPQVLFEEREMFAPTGTGATTTLRPTGGFSCWCEDRREKRRSTSSSTGSRSWSAWSRRSGEEYSATRRQATPADDGYSTGLRWISRSSRARAIT